MHSVSAISIRRHLPLAEVNPPEGGSVRRAIDVDTEVRSYPRGLRWTRFSQGGGKSGFGER